MTMMLYAQVHLTLPAWVHDAVDTARAYEGDDAKVALAIELSRRNVDARSGGPFGAAVFGPDDRVIAVGVNRVLPHTCSVAHAETMAYMLAQQRTQRPRLNENGTGQRVGPITLATSAQPCCQCYGATVWAGIDRLLIGARSEDVEALTEFDEGPLPADWVGELERRGIAVLRDVQRDAACDVLRHYSSSGGARY
ncbi:tRNA(Arg) A34 adenosine deaminase TadA [Lysobacter sp. HA18]